MTATLMNLFSGNGSFLMNQEYVEWPFMTNPTYPPYWFEEFDPDKSRRWLWDNWTLSVYATGLYWLMIFVGQWWMKDRQPFNLRKPLALWNFFLAGFSICGFLRTGPDLYDVLTGENGFHRSVCVRDSLNPPTAFWAYLFTLSKMLELGDTVFIVLRKTPLIFLHWYHHSTVLVFSWLCYPQAEPIFRYVGVMNYAVHSVMYSYYGFKALQFKVPRQLSMVITTLQLSQMILGLIVNIYAYTAKNVLGWECARSDEGLRVLMLMYASYFVLFANFFKRTYLTRKSKTQ
ncbi:elongation of very long chain fatty acids protein 6 [Folsomia candida]|nr:elongation of very long chain fatty acids protein 6 [Folsomia candida]XP_021962854.1 elongation of very long chain fatty acids protein 6 [Folsomia candida]